MTTVSTAAWVAHDLSVATGIGGGLFGHVAMHPALSRVSNERERGQVADQAWKRFNTIQLAAYGVMGLTWLAGRLALSGKEVSYASRPLVIAKDVLVGATVVTAIGAAVSGRAMAAQRPDGGVPVSENGMDLSPDASEREQKLNRLTGFFGVANLICGAGVAAVTAILAQQAGKSTRWSFVSRLLP